MSDLLSSLLGSMTSEDSLKSLSAKTGGSSDQISSVVNSALPQLMQAMGQNASSADGASSLLGALAQHTSTESVEKQIENADTVDGGKILQHILGGNTESVVSSLTSQTGLTSKQVTSVLGSITPALMSSLSGASQSAKASKKTSGVDLSDGLDISDVMALLGQASGGGAGSSFEKKGVLGMLGSLFGK